ncbi:putative cardiolipin synthase [Aminobacter aminovorans]|uniref:Phospholipase D n=1 Tax=Aminobacter aminovorans TaxID=83263 RepID=A0A380WGV7_AMIAI|nr:phospholipase D family protein [Aminobacter aminovorans]TCS21664.1 putative cardiolipin synthase [Aminobacter aminovorans]SUU87592.1 Cardiolipin synthase [Aminobacter aminovorans]
MRLIKAVLALLLVAAVAILAARMLFPLPSIKDRPVETALPPVTEGALAAMVVQGSAENPGKSGVLPIAAGHDAIASRLFLSGIAQRSIDVQYYIWHDDTSGRLLLRALYEASRRGVRVRLLLDDNGIPGLDPTVAALDAQPNFDIRLFNPSMIRSPKLLGYSFDFFRMNRRMHNKSFIVDGLAAIVGGRNIGDEYFKVGDGTYYLDLDVLGAGAVVQDTSKAFDLYWNSASVFASDKIIDPSTGTLEAFLQGADEAAKRPAAADFVRPDAPAYNRLRSGGLGLEWVDVKLVVDDPVKGEGKASKNQLMISRLAELVGPVRHGLDLVSAYFVPGRPGVEYFASLVKGGAKVRILTNALETTDVAMVHAGYSKYRREMLDDGIELFELKPMADAAKGEEELSLTGSSGASLHAKSFAADGDRVFIGSFNFDPRSALLNCEMGFLIGSPTMARAMSQGFDTKVAAGSYRVSLRPDGGMQWAEDEPGKPVVTFEDEPNASAVKRLMVMVFGWLPIEWLL